MKKIFILSISTLVYLTVNAQNIQWQELMGGSADDNLNYNIQQTSDGGYIEVGVAASSNDGTLTGVINNGGKDGWIIKTNASGITQWQKLLGGSNDDLLYSIQQTSDGGYIAAGYSNSSNTGTLSGTNNNGANDGWVIKLDASGNTLWQKFFGGSNNDYLFWIRQTADGGYVAAGQSNSSNDGTFTGVSNHGNLDGWVVKLDATGNVIVWQKLLGGSDDDYFRGIEQTSDLGYILTCGANSFNSGTLTGVPGSTAAGSAWVVKLDATGGTTWQKLFGGNGIDNFITVQQTSPDGGYIAVGYSNTSNDGSLTGIVGNGGMDGWIMKLDGSGNTIWQKLLGGINEDLLVSIQQTPDGGYIAAGYSNSSNSGTLTGITSHGGNDGWLVKLNSGGNIQSQQLWGGNTSDQFQGISQTSDGGYIVAGVSNSSNNGNLTGVSNNGGDDGWLVKFTQFTLPITLSDFTAKKNGGDKVMLQWSTQTENSNKGFSIERSFDNNLFSEITFINSQSPTGNSASKLSYTFIDNTPQKGINYYRLKQVDKDENFSYSKIVAISFDDKELIQVYPNPTKDYVVIYLKNITAGEIVIKVCDVNGKVLSAKKYSSVQQINVSLNKYSPGIYFIRVTDEVNNVITQQKIIKE